MEQVVVTGLGAVLTNATGIIGGWSSASLGEGIFLSIPSQSKGLLQLIRSESHGLFDSPFLNEIERRSVVWGVSKNHYTSFENWVKGVRSMEFFADHDARLLAETFFLGGQVLCPVAACASGAHALILGARLIESGEADVVLCGGSEPPQHPMILAAYRNMGALSPSGVMRPFDRRRDGFLAASGSGFLILESQTHAHKRGARIHARLSGYSMRSDSTHMTSMCPSGDSIVRAIEQALGKAGNPAMGYVNAHGTATRLNDELEGRALMRTVGPQIAVSSTKALTGHLLGASGAVEAVLSILAMKEGRLPPTLGLEETDGELDFVRGTERVQTVDTVLSLNYGFGGHIGAIVFQAP
ncbi:beta-ketoacyl-[acyl-carrier-protein] synthase family protein [bacterium]|nr:MAG: beta-ketoacyl-[acyl-carrier-protein] synthase family protein [bacterium]